MNKVSGIYRIELGNGNFYIGSSVNLAKREREHKNGLLRGKHRNRIVQNCWNKYGVFQFMVLEVCEIPNLLAREQKWINIFFSNPKNTNLALTAGSNLGVIRSDETKAKMSAAQKGRVASDETKAKQSAAHKGIPLSDETKAKMSAAHKGKIRSAEHCLNLSAALKGIPKSAEHRVNNSAAQKGKTLSDETKAKQSAANTGRVPSPDALENMRLAQRRRRAA